MDLSERPSHPFRRHPWEQARFRFFSRIIETAGVLRLPKPLRVLDGGAGDGWFAHQLVERLGPGAEVTCWDPAYTREQMAELATQSHRRITFSSTKPLGKFDLVLLLDVLEHVEDDAGFLARVVADNLDRQRVALVSLPSWSWLFGRHDVRLRHLRRYAPREGTRLLEQAGLEIVCRGGLFHSLLILRAVARMKERLFPGHETPSSEPLEWKHGAVSSRLVEAVLSVDGELSFRLARAHLALPGLSWWALARKPW